MKIYISLIILMISFQANAYIGPGMGVGAIVSAIGVDGAILLAILGIIYYPLKRFIRNRKNK